MDGTVFLGSLTAQTACFFFQAEDVIRYRIRGLEFRRVLFRSIALQCACISMRQGEYDKAASALDDISDKEITEYYRGVLAIYQNDADKAVRLLSDSKDINYAIALLNKNQVKDALKVLQDLDQNDAYVLYTTGVAYGRINENAKAREFKAKAFQLDPSLRYLDN